MAFGALYRAEPIAAISAKHGTTSIWTRLPKLCVLLLGGFTSNFVWCVFLNFKNKSGHQYSSLVIRDPLPQREEETIIETALDAPSEEVVEHMASIIIFSSLWGIALKEWKGSSPGTKNKLMLVLSAVIVGYGNYLGARLGGH